MQNFQDLAYQRPDLASWKTEMNHLTEAFKAANSVEEQMALMARINDLRNELETMYSLCYIRYSNNTKDAFYEAERSFFNQAYPETNAYINAYYQALLNSAFRPELERHWGKQLFNLASLGLKSYEPQILAEVQKDLELGTAYGKIKAQAEIKVKDKTYNLSTLSALEQDADPELRRLAVKARWDFYQSKAEAIEGIYDEMVKNRDQMAKKLGYKNFVGLGYARMNRTDYNAEMLKAFRQEILESVVPLTQRLYERQAKRLGKERLSFHDQAFHYPSGNPSPKGGVAWQARHAQTMYRELSPETHDFYDFMFKGGYMDLESRDGKEPGGYCTFLPKAQAPFIFANFNGTSHDVVVLTHEAGHAFQCYVTAQNNSLQEYAWPTYEACEIHSMSMEFLTWPWMHLFFEQDTEKFKFHHLASTLCFLPYGAAVDEFQHLVYENPFWTKAERNAAWRDLERKYLPHREYDSDLGFLEAGGFWQQQQHIFSLPFYYIDYVLAQICAYQYWIRFEHGQRDSAWQDYLRLCKAGGSQSFLDLVKTANLRSPFDSGCVAWVVGEIEAYLEGVDDGAF